MLIFSRTMNPDFNEALIARKKITNVGSKSEVLKARANIIFFIVSL